MENEFECLSDRGGYGGHLAEKFLKKYCSYPELLRLLCRNLPVVTRRRLAISVIISKRGFLIFFIYDPHNEVPFSTTKN